MSRRSVYRVSDLGCLQETIKPSDYIKAQYGLPEGTTATPGNELGIFESLNDHYVKEDMDAYFSNIYP